MSILKNNTFTLKSKISAIFIALLLISIFFIFSKKFHYCIPVNTIGLLPAMHISIEEKKYNLLIDTGAKNSLYLKNEEIKKIKKKKNYGKAGRMNYLGNEYPEKIFYLNSIDCGSFKLKHIEITSDILPEDTRSSTLFKKLNGSIGLTLLKRHNIFLDFPNSRIFLSDDTRKIKNLGFSFKKAIKVPFIINQFICFPIETDTGIHNAILDTGSNYNFIRQSPPSDEQHDIETTKFIMGGHDFGPQEITEINITPKLEQFNFIVGMDFIIPKKVQKSGI